jgi:hypothetical protein
MATERDVIRTLSDSCNLQDVLADIKQRKPNGFVCEKMMVTILGGKHGRCVRLTTLPPSFADCLEIWEPQTPETLRACPGL